MKQHPFLIERTCFWHHEWEICGECGEGDKPDDPQKPFHLHHDEEVERQRQIHAPRQWHETEEECRDRQAGNWLVDKGWRLAPSSLSRRGATGGDTSLCKGEVAGSIPALGANAAR